jgi:hypothetical protein
MKKISILILALMMLSMIGVVSATCVYTTDVSDGRDFYGMTSTAYNNTQWNGTRDYTDVIFQQMDWITPRLNFTVHFTEYANYSNTTNQHFNLFDDSWQLDYYNATNISVYSGLTNITSQVSYVQGASSLILDNSSYEHDLLTITYDRLFIKNVDNMVDAPGTICTLCGSGYDLNTSSFAYGSSVGVKLRDSDLDGNNWAVTWENTERSCAVEPVCSSPVNSLLFNILAGMFMLGMIVFVVFTLKDGASVQQVVAVVVGFLVMIVALVIINSLVQSFCTAII